MKKFVILFLGLLLPVLVFIFLKYFGKNEFDVPPLHETEVTSVANCSYEYKTPYIISDSVRQMIGPAFKPLAIVYSGEGEARWDAQIEKDFSEVHIEKMAHWKISEEQKQKVKSCVLLMEDPSDIALVDANGRIRGYYNSTDRDEIDRLKVELSILLKKY